MLWDERERFINEDVQGKKAVERKGITYVKGKTGTVYQWCPIKQIWIILQEKDENKKAYEAKEYEMENMGGPPPYSEERM